MCYNNKLQLGLKLKLELELTLINQNPVFNSDRDIHDT